MKIRLIIIVLALLASCTGKKEPRFVNLRGTVFGTYYSISYYCLEGRNYQHELNELFQEINESLSYYVNHSLISRINRNETQIADDYFLEVLQTSLQIARETRGAFDPTISPLVNAWGFGFTEKQKLSPQIIDSLLQFVGYEKVRVEGNRVRKSIPELQFDFNAIAKGYAADLGGLLLESKGVTSYMVELGGDLVARGLKPDGSPWRIGLEKPATDMHSVQQWDYLVEMHNLAVATSGNYRKYYEQDGQRFSHTIDPSTGYPVNHSLLSASVFAANCAIADAYATAFMVMGLEKTIDFVRNRSDLQVFLIYDSKDPNEEYGVFVSEGLTVIPRSQL